MLNFLRGARGRRERKLPPTCSGCGKASLYAARRRQLGLCTACERKRAFKRRFYSKVKAAFPEVRCIWTKRETMALIWTLENGAQFRHEIGTEDLIKNEDSLGAYILVQKHAAMRLATKSARDSL